MNRNLLLLSLTMLLISGCKKDEKQYSLRLVVDGGNYVSLVARIANDKRTPIAVDTTSGHSDVTIPALAVDDILLVRVTNIGKEPVHITTYSTGELAESKTINKGDSTYHQYYIFTPPSEKTKNQLLNDSQRQYLTDNGFKENKKHIIHKPCEAKT